MLLVIFIILSCHNSSHSTHIHIFFCGGLRTENKWVKFWKMTSTCRCRAESSSTSLSVNDFEKLHVIRERVYFLHGTINISTAKKREFQLKMRQILNYNDIRTLICIYRTFFWKICSCCCYFDEKRSALSL